MSGIGIIIPENDTQELWEMNGMVNALRGFLQHEKENSNSSNPVVYVDEIEAIMG